MRALAEVAAGMTEADIIGVPIINSTDGIAGDVSAAFITRSAAENASPPEDGSVRLPTEQRVEEMLGGKEDKSNKVTSLSASSTDAQYPSAKCVYDMIGNVEALLAAL